MNDYIKREDAIKILNSLPWTSSADHTRKKNLILLFTLYNAADVRENVKGEWVVEYDDDAPIFFKRRWVCSACGDYQTYGKPKFCPNCGAEMGGDSHEVL